MEFQESKNKSKTNNSALSLKNIKSVLKYKSIWLMMIIIISAYVGYKITDIYSLYAYEVMLYSETKAAEIGSLQLYLRPIVCIFFGFLADKSLSLIHI